MSEVGTPIIEEPDRHDNPGTVAKGQCDLQPNEAADGPCMSAAQVLMGKLIAKADIESSDSVYLSRFGLPERQSEENKESGIPIEPAKEEHKFTDEGKARMALLTQILLKSTQNEKSEAPARSVWAPNPVVTKNEPTSEDQDQTRDPKVRVAPKSESFDNAQDILRARAIDRNKQQDGDNSIVRSKGTIYHSSGNVSSIVRANPAPVVRPQPSTDSSSRTKLQDFPTYNPDARSSSTSSTTPTPGIRTVSSGNRISHLAQPTVTPTPTNPTVIPRISPNPTSTTPKPVSNPYSTPYPNMYVHPHNNSFPTSPNVVPIAAPGSRSPYVVPPAAYTTHAPPSNIRQHVYPASPTHSQVAHPPAKGVGRSTSAPSVSSASPALLHQTASRPNAHSHLNHFAAYPTNTRPLA